jgi:L-rhamnose mutarotase
VESIPPSRLPSTGLSVSTSACPSADLATPADIMYSQDVLDNPVWLAVALALSVDPALTHKKGDTSLRMHYCKYLAFESAWDQIQLRKKQNQWPYTSFLKTELINLFGRRGMWNSHTVKGMADIPQYPEMRRWLERKDDETDPTDQEVWGIIKAQYTFKDLSLWKMQGTLGGRGDSPRKKIDKGKAKSRDEERSSKKQRVESDVDEGQSSKAGKKSSGSSKDKSSKSGSKTHKRK